MLTTTDSLLTQLAAISRKAGAAILEIYHDEARFDRVDFKADDSPLTLADQAAHHAIVAELDQLSPIYPILSEEGRAIPYAERSQWNRFWLVDPLDGTKEFIKRNGEFTVNIALVENGAVVMGCVHVPVSGKTYLAAKGEGAFVQETADAPLQRITASEFTMADKGLRLVCSRSHMSAEVEAYVKQFEEPELVSMGSSLKLLMVAEGNADIYPRLGPTMEWDTAAAQIIVEEAGGVVLRDDTQEPLTYNKENLLNPYFLVFGQRK
ncbi:MAG: 3'(2'),5'-bisphosphate nucleotidase CysQ [Bacteroidota bacterium]